MIGVGNSLANINESEFDGISLNGTTDFLELPYPVGRVQGGSTDLTISFWAKPSDTGATEYIASQYVSTTYFWYVAFLGSTNKMTFYARSISGTWASVTPTSGILSTGNFWDKWSHYCISIDASEETAKWYINGSPITSTVSIDNTKSLASVTLPTYIGRRASNQYGGPYKLASFALWNGHVDDTAVQNIYKAGPKGLLNVQDLKNMNDENRQCYYVFDRKNFNKEINGGALNGINAQSGWFENLGQNPALAWQATADLKNQDLSTSNIIPFSNNDCDDVTIDGKNFLKFMHTDAGHDLILSFDYLDANHITHSSIANSLKTNTAFILNLSYYISIPSGANFQISMGANYLSFNKDTIEQHKVHTANVVCSNASTGYVPFWVVATSPATNDYIAVRINSVRRMMGAITQTVEPEQLTAFESI